MSSTVIDHGAVEDTTAGARPGPPSRWRRVLAPPPGRAVWERPALLALLVVTAGLYLWDLSASGWANSFYAAAVQAGTKSWRAFFFGSSDSSNFITVDKPPASLWVMEISARIFGLNSWSLLVPQALEGVACVGVLYATVRRTFSAGAALIAGAVLALTPVAALMFRFNNPDALLVLLLTIAAYTLVRALEDGRTRWLVLAGLLIGTGFITKMMQAFLVLPAFAVVYLLAGPPRFWVRFRQVVYGGIAMLVAAGWWVVAVELTPYSDRPYIGGSQDNNLFNLIFGYNGFGRLTGNETGSVGGGGGGGSTGMWGPTGWNRLFTSNFGGQISWLIPSALILLGVGLYLRRRSGRTDPGRAQYLIWGGWLLVTGLTFSYASGIIHPYYSVALAPAIGALIGIGAAHLWQQRENWVARLGLAASIAVAGVWSYVLLDRSASWHPWLRVVVLVASLAVAVWFAGMPRLAGRLSLAAAGVGLVAVLAGPAAYTLQTVTTAHTGSIPSAGPSVSGGNGFGGGARGGAANGRPGGTRTGGSRTQAGPGGNGGFGGGGGGGFGGGAPGGTGTTGTTGTTGGTTGTRRGFGGGGGTGGLLDSSTPSATLTAALKANAKDYTWVAATVGSNSASGYQLASGDAVMAIGGFNGTDPYPTLAQFEADVAKGEIHYFIPVSSGGGRGGSTRGTDYATEITSWVGAHYTSSTIGGTTVYDLTSTASTSSTTSATTASTS